MKFSIIIPSFNQPDFIQQTLENVIAIKKAAVIKGFQIEILLFDSESNELVQSSISKFIDQIDVLEVKKDKGQFDAINKGIERCTGDYWTWLNTDDTLDFDGFFKLAAILKNDPGIDYIYGGIDYIDEKGKYMRTFNAYDVELQNLTTKVPGIFQQGSFFRREFAAKLGLLKNYNCCFDYEFVLRCLKNNARVYVCDFKVANFRQHTASKTGSLTPMFIKEQLLISKDYGRKWFHFLSWFSQLRLIKHKLFPR